MAVPGVLPPLLAKVPPAPPSDQVAAVAPPPNDPPSAAVVPPWQIAVTDPPTLTVGNGLTVTVTLLLVAGNPLAQGVDVEFMTTLITVPDVRFAGEKVELVAPLIFNPFICH